MVFWKTLFGDPNDPSFSDSPDDIGKIMKKINEG